MSRTAQAELCSRYYALDLADAFIADHNPDDAPFADEVRPIILSAGELLAELGQPGQWEAFDPATYRQRVAFLSHHKLVLEFIHLTALFTWMGDTRLMHPEHAGRIVTAIKGAVPEEPLLSSLCDRGLGLLTSDPQLAN